MDILRLWSVLLVLCGIGSYVQSLSASSMVVRQMNLEQLCAAAGRIFRGTVIGVSDGTVRTGGGELPTVVYRIRVDEAFKGSFETIKGQRIATVQMVRATKAVRVGDQRRLPLFDDLPTFERGHDYLILATTASRAGLSLPVGLGQGAFKVEGKPGEEVAANAADNIGLFRGMSTSAARGPVNYATLRAQIRQILGR